MGHLDYWRELKAEAEKLAAQRSVQSVTEDTPIAGVWAVLVSVGIGVAVAVLL